MDAHFILFGTRLHTNKPILIVWISIVFILGRNRFYYSKTDYLGMKSRTPPDFTGHLRFWKQKYLVQNWREFLQEKSSPLLCLYKIRWLISPISCCTSLAFCDTLLGWWMNGKFSFLNKVAFNVVYRQNSTWLLVDIGLLLSISHERAHWTRDISSWSLEEKLHWYNITHSVNSSLSIQLWQSVTFTSLRRKGIFLIASVLH